MNTPHSHAAARTPRTARLRLGGCLATLLVAAPLAVSGCQGPADSGTLADAHVFDLITLPSGSTFGHDRDDDGFDFAYELAVKLSRSTEFLAHRLPQGALVRPHRDLLRPPGRLRRWLASWSTTPMPHLHVRRHAPWSIGGVRVPAGTTVYVLPDGGFRYVTWLEVVHDGVHYPVGSELEHTPEVGSGIDFYTPESRPVIAEAFRRALELGEPFDHELEIVTAKGRVLPVRAVGQPIVEDGEVVRIAGSFQDLSEVREREGAQRRLTGLLNAITDASSDVIFVKDTEGVVLFGNPAYANALGRPVDEIVGTCEYDYFSDEESLSTLRAADAEMPDIAPCSVSSATPRGALTRPAPPDPPGPPPEGFASGLVLPLTRSCCTFG